MTSKTKTTKGFLGRLKGTWGTLQELFGRAENRSPRRSRRLAPLQELEDRCLLSGAPIAKPDHYSAVQGTKLNVNNLVGVLNNDTDPQGNSLHALLVSGPSNGALTLNNDGSFTYTGNAGFAGTDTFTYVANDGSASSNTATVTLTVSAVQSPVAHSYNFSTTEGQQLNVGGGQGVLSNDTDPQGQPLTAVEASGPTNGTLSFNNDGSFHYTPTPGFVGTDSFTYRASNGWVDSAPATVTITVAAAPPTANNDFYAIGTGANLTIGGSGVLANDTDPGALPLTATLVQGPAFGNVTLHANGSFTYHPQGGFTGNDHFQYEDTAGGITSNPANVNIMVGSPAAQPPTATSESYTTTEGASFQVSNLSGVLINDTDPQGLQLHAQLVNGPSNGALRFNNDGSFQYTPNFNFTGIDTFTYQANDNQAQSNIATVTITVTPVAAPTANSDSYALVQGTTLNATSQAGVLANDSNPQGSGLNAVLVSGPANGTLTLNQDGSFTYTPNLDFVGTDSFTYQNNAAACSNVATVTLTVAAAQPPAAQNDTYGTNVNQPLNIGGPGVLSNDTDPQGRPLTTVLVSGPSDGTLTLNANGSFNYAPNANFKGFDTFSYAANDGISDSTPTTVTMAVFPSPIAGNDNYNVNQANTLSVTAANGVLTNDSDPNGFAITAALANGPGHGSVTLNPDGSFTYTPNANFYGVDTFKYDAVDQYNNNSRPATVSITVYGAPQAQNDNYNNPVQGTLFSVNAVSGVLHNDQDPDNLPLTVSLVTGPAHGSLLLHADGSFTYVGNASYVGNDSFTYLANDGRLNSNVATVTLQINAAQAPHTLQDQYTTYQGATLYAAPFSGVLANDSDPQGRPLTATLVTNPTGGTLTFNSDGSFTYVGNPTFYGNDSFTYEANNGLVSSTPTTVKLTVQQVTQQANASNDNYTVNQGATLATNPATGILANDSGPQHNPLVPILISGPQDGALALQNNGAFTYTPNPSFAGKDYFTYEDYDGITYSPIATVQIQVNAVQPPNVHNYTYNVLAGQSLGVDPPSGVLSQDSDHQGLPLTAGLVSGPANGTLTFHQDGSFNYTPNPGFYGKDVFTYTANDGLVSSNVANVQINVSGPPVADNDYYVTTPNLIVASGKLIVTQQDGVLANDTDPNGKGLNATLTNNPGHGTLSFSSNGAFQYTPNLLFVGTDSFQYTVSDGTYTSNKATVTITVTAASVQAPVANNDSYSVAEGSSLQGPIVLANDTDPNGLTLAAQVVNGPAHGTLSMNGNGQVNYTPNFNFYGTDTFTYQANDGEAQSNFATVTITVTPVAPPVAVNDSYSLNPATVFQTNGGISGVLGNDTNPPQNGPFNAILVSGPSHGNLNFNNNGQFTYTPNANFSGIDTFTYVDQNQTAYSNVATVTLTVNAVVPPVAVADSYTAIQGNSLHTDGQHGVLINDTDPQGRPMTAVLTGAPSHGTLTLNSDGTFTYRPDPTFNGTDIFTYEANDGLANSNVATVTIDVVPPPAPPVAYNDAYSTYQGGTLTVAAATGLLANDSHSAGTTLTAMLTSAPSNGTVTLDADGSFTYTPNLGFTGTDSITYYAFDGVNTSNIATVTLAVNSVAPPVAANDSFNTSVNTPLNVAAAGVLANDSDSQNHLLTAALVNGPSNGAVILNADGSFTYTPNANYFGPDSFTYQANDGLANSNVAAVSLTITPLAPVAANDSFSTSVNTPLNVGAAGVLVNDSDSQAQSLSAVLVANPTHGTLSLASDGSFRYTPDLNYSGTDSFTYQANDGLANSNVATVNLNVSDSASTTSIVASANPSTYGQSVSFTATVSGIASTTETPTGSVTFFDGPTSLATITLSAGSATCTTSALGAGVHDITITYGGDANFSANTSNALAETITPATLTVTANDASQIYGQVNSEFTDTISGFVNGDTPTVVSGNASLTTTATTSSGVGAYAISAAQGSLNAANYTFSFSNGSLNVTPAALTIAADNASKTYGQSLTFAGTEFTTSGLVNADTVNSATLTSAGAAATATVSGSPYAITASAATGTGLANYTISYVDGGLTVNPASLTITANDASKTYGQSLTFTGTEFTTSGLVNADTVSSATLTSAGTAATATVSGSPYAITASAATGTGLANYTISYVDGGLTVNPASLTITANDASKTYGQSLTFAGTEFTTSGLVNSDTVSSATLTSAGTAATATVSGSPYAITASAATGTGLANYTISYVDGALNVTPATLTITADNASKTYGQTLTFAGTEFTTSGLVNADTVNSATLTSAGAAATATVSGSPYAITASAATGTGLANYTISYVDGGLTVNPASLTITANDASKTYGQSLTFTGTEFTTSGLVNADTVSSATLTSAGTAATATVSGSPYAITASAATGTGLANYTISYVDGGLTVNPASLTITANDASKTYGQSLTFAGTEFTTSGLVNADTVSSVTLTSAGVAATATVSGSPYAITASAATGTGLANYTISYVNGALNVTPATLTITADNASKTYGQSLTFAGTEFTTSGLVNADTVSSVTLTSAGVAATATVSGSPYAITASAATGTGLANYTISYVNGALNVTPATLTITADNASKTYGQSLTFAGTEFTTSGLVNADTVSSATLTSAGAAATATVSGSPYAITASAATGTGLANYTISYVNGALNVTPATLTITADNASKTYGQSLTFAGTEFTTSGLVNADTVSSATLTSAGAAATATVSGSPYAITASAATGTGLANYTISYVDGGLTVNLASLTITANDASKTYGQSLTFAGTEFTTSGLVNADTVSSVTLTSAGVAATATVSGSPYAITASAATGTGLANYTISYVNGSLNVTSATLTITADNASKTYGQSLTFAGTEFTTSGLVNADTVSSATLTSAGAAATATVSGSPYAISASAATGTGLANYTISYVNGALNVTPATLTITADNASKTYGQSLTFAGTEFTTSGLVNADTVSSATLTSAGAAATATVSGSPYAITASAATGTGLANYTISYVNGALNVTSATLTITADNASKTYGQSLTFAGTEFTTSGLVNADTVNSATLTSAGVAATATVSGSPYAITASAATGAGLGNYNIAYVNGTLEVAPATLTVTAKNATKVYGQASPAFSDAITGFVNGDNASVVGGSASLSTAATAGGGVGSYPVTAAQGSLSAANYTFAFTNGTLTVTPVAVPPLPPSSAPTPQASIAPASPAATPQTSIPPVSLIAVTPPSSPSGGGDSAGASSAPSAPKSGPTSASLSPALFVTTTAPNGHGSDAATDSSLAVHSGVNSATRTIQVFSPIPQGAWREGQTASGLVTAEIPLDVLTARVSASSASSLHAHATQHDDGFDVLNDEGERVPWTEPGLETTMVLGSGVIAASGYVFLNSRLGLWLLGLLTSQPLWKPFDPLEVLYAWEDEEDRVKDDQDEETLLSLVD